MIHKKCGGTIEIDCSSLYLIRSAGLRVTTRGILPGVIQIDSTKNKSTTKLVCSQCHEILFSKDDYQNEIVDKCIFCQENHSTDELKVIDGLGMVCIKCISNINSGKMTAKDKLLLYYGDIIKGKEFPTLLTILMKK
jgi:hypothetical protein